MGEMYFPGEEPDNVETLYDRAGHLIKRYRAKNGGTGLTEHHYRQGEGSPLMWADYWSDYRDKTNRETLFFEGKAGEETPYLSRIYRQNRLVKETGLGERLRVRYSEEYEYCDGETMPISIRHEDFDEKGNSLSVIIKDKDNPFGKVISPKKISKIMNTLKKAEQNGMQAVRSGKMNQRINERSIR